MGHLRQPYDMLPHEIPISKIAHKNAPAIPAGYLDFLEVENTKGDGMRDTISIRKKTGTHQI